MKRLLSLLAIVAIISASNCSRIPENNDPVIGIWSKIEQLPANEVKKQTVRQEWIFNDVFLGRYHRYSGNTLEFKTDFKWEQADGLYTLHYPGTDLEKNRVLMKDSPEGMLLEDIEGKVFAKRE